MYNIETVIQIKLIHGTAVQHNNGTKRTLHSIATALKVTACYFSYSLHSIPSGGFRSTFPLPTSPQLVLSTVPPDSTYNVTHCMHYYTESKEVLHCNSKYGLFGWIKNAY